jgi:hypothetical protein
MRKMLFALHPLLDLFVEHRREFTGTDQEFVKWLREAYKENR